MNFAHLTALEARDAIRARRFSAKDYISALADVIEAREPEIEAWEYFDRNYALQQAAASDGLDPEDYPLLGVPVGVKDIIDTADMPTRSGTILDADRQPLADATVVRLLRQAGAVIMGKTVTTELAYYHPGKTRNPHNRNHTPGGSSSGSAASVASGMVPVALGTQTNGSVIRPASFCGIYGLKTTNGLIPRAGVLEQAPSLDTVGFFARSLEDLAAVANVLAIYDPGDSALKPHGRVDYLEAFHRADAATPRLAFIKTPSWEAADEAARQAFVKLAEDLKPHCDEVELPAEFDRAVSLHRTIMLAEIAVNYGRYYDRGRDFLSAAMRKAIEDGRSISAVDYRIALRMQNDLYFRLLELIAPYDAIVTPSAPGLAPQGLETTGNPVFCTPWTYLQMPALNLPLLQIDGMPLGVQLVARRFEEKRLFRCGRWLVEFLKRRGEG